MLIGKICIIRLLDWIPAFAKDTALKAHWKFSMPVPEVKERMSVFLETEGEVQWEKAQSTLTLPDGTDRSGSEAISNLFSILSGKSGISVFDFTPQTAGLHRVRILLCGKTPAGETVNRCIDRTFQVEVQGKGVKYRRDIDPFIRRRAGGLK